eukprot:SM000054S18085  [mRNA]  locus=s54:311371:315139:+ [translate_table: standard]
MVVCKCRKATRLYCFVHKVPVCADCVAATPDHALCAVKTYSEWVIDGDYDWPPLCAACRATLEPPAPPPPDPAAAAATTRLSCLHVLHTQCLLQHLQSFPPYTAPAGYVCPACAAPVGCLLLPLRSCCWPATEPPMLPPSVWPLARSGLRSLRRVASCILQIWSAKSHKDAHAALYTRLQAVILQSSAAGTLLGSEGASTVDRAEPALPDPASVASPPTADRPPPTNQASDNNQSLVAESSLAGRQDGYMPTSSDPPSAGSARDVGQAVAAAVANAVHDKPVVLDAATKTSADAETGPATLLGGQLPLTPSATSVSPNSASHLKSSASTDYNEDDEDGTDRKYARRGPAYRQLLRHLGLSWSTSLPGLPVTREEADGTGESRPRRRSHRRPTDPRKLLLVLAILSCLATMVLLYYRLAQALNATSQEVLLTERPGDSGSLGLFRIEIGCSKERTKVVLRSERTEIEMIPLLGGLDLNSLGLPNNPSFESVNQAGVHS